MPTESVKLDLVMTKTALITGGTGSFGKTMLQHLLEQGYETVRIYSRDEEKQHELRTKLNDRRVQFYIGDIRDRSRLEIAMAGIDRVFHAAALKQVPSCEFFPMEAIRTNVIGSENVIEAAAAKKVKSVVLLSTDKAVFPINAMGMTKALMEKLVAAKARLDPDCETVFSVVRYGNVTGSRGSVIPLFIAKIMDGLPLTITNPDMTRFLLPLPQTVKLVEHAFAHARQGDTFIRKAPAATVQDIADAMLDLFNSKVGTKIIGERHGEKLYETLATSAEIQRSEDMGDYIRIPVDTRDLNYELYFDKGHAGEAPSNDYHSHNTEQLDFAATRKLLIGLPIVTDAMKRAGISAGN
jgi:UDP-N-acetylglucosamine 4,6-dehydratase